jgi:hypothetical protein
MPRDLPLAGATTERQVLSIWSHKPWWCQPWSILLTGVAVVTISWLVFGRWWLSLVVAIAVLIWWGLFLVLVPAAWRQEAQTAAAGSSPGPSLDAGGGR